MKNIFIIFLCLLLLFSCKKEDNEFNDIPTWAKATALKNGANWSSDKPLAFEIEVGYVSLRFSVLIRNTKRSKEILAYNLPLKIGKYENLLQGPPLFNRDSVPNIDYVYSVFDGDVVGGGIFSKKDTLNKITIESIDTKLRKITGQFSATYYIEETHGLDTFNITKGVYEVHY
jgi:hypothetical protein